MASSDLRDELKCSVCLSPYTDPVSLRCGHNFCRSCIVRALDAQEEAGAYSCPDCRAEYPERPALVKNRKLGNIVQRYLSTQPEMEETRIFCTYCTQSSVPAVKSCLQCEISLCDDHLTAHNKTVDHVVTEPTRSFGKKKCSTHKKVLEYYCPQDATCLCVSCCLVGKHRGHQVELLDEASEEKKKKLREYLDELNPQRAELQRRVQNMHDHKRNIRKKASEKSKNIRKFFMALKKQLEKTEKKVLSEISRQEDKIVSQISYLINELEIKEKELSRKMSNVEEMCRVSDPIRLLQESDITVSSNGDRGNNNFEGALDETSGALDETAADPHEATGYLSMEMGHLEETAGALDETAADPHEVADYYSEMDDLYDTAGDMDEFTGDPHESAGYLPMEMLSLIRHQFGRNINSITSELRYKTPDMLLDEISNDLDQDLISLTLHRSMRDIVSNVTSEVGFQLPDIVLDVDTAYKNVEISDSLKTATEEKKDNPKTATTSNVVQDRPESPGRFLSCSQVLSRCGFSSGRHYWEVKWNQTGTCSIGMSYPSIERDGDKSGFGYNDKSWCLFINDESYQTSEDSFCSLLNMIPTCSTFGVFLDYEAGRLSFYELCDPIRHVHTFTASFTEPLYVGFYMEDGASVTLLR